MAALVHDDEPDQNELEDLLQPVFFTIIDCFERKSAPDDKTRWICQEESRVEKYYMSLVSFEEDKYIKNEDVAEEFTFPAFPDFTLSEGAFYDRSDKKALAEFQEWAISVRACFEDFQTNVVGKYDVVQVG